MKSKISILTLITTLIMIFLVPFSFAQTLSNAARTNGYHTTLYGGYIASAFQNAPSNNEIYFLPQNFDLDAADPNFIRFNSDGNGKLTISDAGNSMLVLDNSESLVYSDFTIKKATPILKLNGEGIGNGGILGRIRAYSSVYGGALVGGIDFQGDASWSGGDYPTRIVFETTDDGVAFPSEKMRITNSGNVGIGTSNPTQKLSVNGPISIGTGNANNQAGTLRWNNNMFQAYNGSQWIALVTTNDVTGSSSTIWEKNFDDIYYDAGKVGIGTSTPSAHLTVYSDANSGLQVGVGSANNLQIYTGAYQRINTTGNLAMNVGTSSGVNDLIINVDNTEKMRIKGNTGNVGIGTVNPVEKLDVSGNILISGDGTFNGGDLTVNSSTNPGRTLRLSSNSDQFILPANDLYIDYPGSIIFRDTDISNRHTFRINDNGNIGVNTSNPLKTLDVNGDIRATREIETSTNVRATGDLIGTDILASGTVTIGSSSSDDTTLGTLRWNSSNKAIEVLTASNTWSSLAKSSDIPSQNSNLWSDCSGSICNIDEKPVKITGNLKLEPTNVENKSVYKAAGMVYNLDTDCVASQTPAQDVCYHLISNMPSMSCDTSWGNIDCASEVTASDGEPDIKYDHYATVSYDDAPCTGAYVTCNALKYQKQVVSTVTGGDLDIQGELSVNGISGFDLSFYTLTASTQNTYYKDLDKHAFCFLQSVYFSGKDSSGGDLTNAVCDVYPTNIHSDGDYDWKLKASFEHGTIVECKSICVD